MEKRVFLAIFLSFIVLVGFEYFFAPAVPSTAPQSASQAQATPTPPASTSNVASAETPVAQGAAAVPAPAVLVADTTERDIVVETNVVRAVFSTRGGVLKSWRLKKYHDSHGDPLELVPIEVPDKFPRPFALATNDAAVSARLAKALFQPSVDHLDLGASPGTLTFTYRDVSGLNAQKTFQFQQDGVPYIVGVNVSVDVSGVARPVTIQWGPAVGLGYSEESSRFSYASGAVQLRNGSMERPSPTDLGKQPLYQGAFKFAGVGDQYFLTAVLPGVEKVQIEYQPINLSGPREAPTKNRTFVAYTVETPGPASLRFFMGPKDFDMLKSIDPEFVRAINFGMFAPLVVPLLQALKWIYRFIPNYGVSIIVLTAFINLLIFPLRHRSMVSMKKMQAVQPQVKAIQERYKKFKVTDPERQKMNSEMMALYKEKGINPASGCLPMVLTFPVLFAFYAMLAAAIELRGAPFFGWIQDLSVHDPLYITPVLMGATMFWQQRSMPSTQDPMQQKMFLVLPIVFTVGFFWAPAGLVVYWLSSNLMAIGQQYWTNHLIASPTRALPGSRAK